MSNPRSYSDLFRLYQAECFAEQKPAASASTFFRTLRTSSWRKKLKFRHVSNHAQCMTCHRLKSAIKHAKTIASHAKAADQYMRHLSGIFADRQTYGQLKWRAIHQKDIICMIIDSMDRSKFRMPRFPDGRRPKSLETRKRPELEVTAAIVHGRAVLVYVTDEDATTGSDWSLEVLSLALDRVFRMGQEANQPWPAHLRLWTDNTPKERVSKFLLNVFCFPGFTYTCGVSFTACKEYRNSILGHYCCHLCTTKCFSSIAHEHLVIGHTHEDVGCFYEINFKF